MLKFINDNDFLLADSYRQNEGGSVSWVYDEGEGKYTHSGVIFDGLIREVQVQDGTESVLVGTKKVKIGQESVLVGTEPLLDSDGNVLLDENGEPQQQEVYEDMDIFNDEDIYEDQPKYKTETVDIWAKFQALVSQGAITLETDHLLLEQKESAKDSINATRDALNDADIEYNGYTFQAGAQSREDIMGAVVTASDTIWLTRDNQEIEMSAEDMRGLGLAIANRKKFLVYKARHFKDALVVLDNEAAINDHLANLDWSA